VKTIRAKTMLAMTLVGLLPVLLLIGISATRTKERLNEERHSRHAAVTREISRHILSALINAKEDLASLASNPTLINDGVAVTDRQAELNRLQRHAFTDISLLDGQGFIIQSTASVDYVQEYSPWFKHTQNEREATISSPFLTALDSALRISVYLPAEKSPPGDVSVIRATISFDRIVEVLKPVEIESGAQLALLDQNGNVLFCSTPRELLEKWDESVPRSFWSESHQEIYTDPLGNPFRFVRSGVTLPDQIGKQKEWSLIWFEPASTIEAAIAKIYLSHGLAALFALSLAVGTGWLVSRRLTRPIAQLRDYSKQISRGNLDAELVVGSRGELGDLASTMAMMGQEIKESRQKLKETLLNQAKSRENNILVNEIHHRVKNNLQIIGSLFRMNLRRIQGEEARRVICESESRLRSMSLLHEAMHRSGSVSEVGIGRYLMSVADSLMKRHFQQTGEEVKLDFDVSERLLGLDTALPCGLIVNELVSHCLEAGAASGSRSSQRIIELQLVQASEKTLELTVVHRDSAGDAECVRLFDQSLSFSLVNMMANQLDGEHDVNWTAAGFCGRMRFEENVYVERVGTMTPVGA
jgi:two-component sensor histidine kinase